jgi:UDP-N-acetylglucosamine--N-acetylmuramyl-(pentapeptide) pyrophosphoryl-undecaprenol N-acetylglucosamine transferase
MGVLLGKPLVLHEQNSVAGLANKVLAGVADRCSPRSPTCCQGAVGGQSAAPAFLPARPGRAVCRPQRPCGAGGGRQPGRQGAERHRAAGAGADPSQRPQVTHQSGEKQIDELRANYAGRRCAGRTDPIHRRHRTGLCRCRPGDLPRRCQHRDRDRGGGCGRLFVPFPFAVDDHQTTNARSWWMQGGGWLVPQRS